MRLGEMLVAEKLITADAVDEALESQMVHGGRLGTNLLELGLLSEKDLARMLGKQRGVPYECGEVKPDRTALQMIHATLAESKEICPLRLDATRLTLAVINPTDFETFDKIAFKIGKRVVPVIIPEFRMNQLLRRHYDAPRPLRAIDMNTVRASKTLRRQQAQQQAESGEAPAQIAELTSEEEFHSLYATLMSGRDRAGLRSSPEAVGRLPPSTAPEGAGRVPPSAAPEAAGHATPPAPPQAADRDAPPIEPWVETPPPPKAAAEKPLSFAEAQAQLGQSADRDQIARTILRFAIGKWKRAVLFSVQGHLLSGWDGIGDGVRRDAVKAVALSLKEQNTFRLVRDTRAHYLGPIKRDLGTSLFYKLLGDGYPKSAVLLPLLLRGKVVHILYVDNGADQFTSPEVGELLILLQSVARCYETMLQRRKAAG